MYAHSRGQANTAAFTGGGFYNIIARIAQEFDISNYIMHYKYLTDFYHYYSNRELRMTK